jgi:tetratricopeptide (TPR) repeat protein
LHAAQAIGDQSGMVTALINLGVIAYNQGRLDEARQSLSEALTKSRRLGLKSSAALALNALGDLLLVQDDLDGAGKSYRESLDIETQTGEQGGIAAARLALAGLELERDRAAQAIALARQAAAEFQAEKNGDEEAAAGNLTARALIAQNHLDQAQAELNRVRSLTISDKLIALSLDLTAARLLNAQRKTKESLKKLSGFLAETRRLQLPGYEFQARLAQAEALALSGDAASARSSLRKLQADAGRAGFKLMARKAANAEQSIDTRNSAQKKADSKSQPLGKQTLTHLKLILG